LRALARVSIEAVKFFGHSLGEMDYSYFRSVFDSVDLYKAKMRLVFYYSIFNDKRAEEIRRSQFLLVTKLIDDYQALDGQRGRNLMHKLMLEGRLSIEEISTKEAFELHSRNCTPYMEGRRIGQHLCFADWHFRPYHARIRLSYPAYLS
jgi:hypothetical protein